MKEKNTTPPRERCSVRALWISVEIDNDDPRELRALLDEVFAPVRQLLREDAAPGTAASEAPRPTKAGA